MLAIVPALAMAQSEKTNKGAHYLEVKTGLAISDAPFVLKDQLEKGVSFDMRYAYGLINNMDIIASLTSYNGYKSFDKTLYARYEDIDCPNFGPMYYCNTLQVGVRGKVKCFDFMNLKLSLTGGLAYSARALYRHDINFTEYPPYPSTDLCLSPCFGGMFEVDFDITKRLSLGLFFGRTITTNTFDNTGLSLSVRL